MTSFPIGTFENAFAMNFPWTPWSFDSVLTIGALPRIMPILCEGDNMFIYIYDNSHVYGCVILLIYSVYLFPSSPLFIFVNEHKVEALGLKVLLA